MINLYCDESNHLLHNNPVMILGFIACESSKVKKANTDLRALKIKHGLDPFCELKWTKVSESMSPLYTDLISYFNTSSYLGFRCIIADKSNLDHQRFSLTHDDWYYRMYYLLLGKTLSETNKYNVYIDIKDTCSSNKISKLKEVLNNSYYDFSSDMVQKVQLVQSHEIELMQLCDLFIGAIGYVNNSISSSPAKLHFIDILRSHYSNIEYTTSVSESKFNIFKWEGR